MTSTIVFRFSPFSVRTDRVFAAGWSLKLEEGMTRTSVQERWLRVYQRNRNAAQTNCTSGHPVLPS